MSICLCNCSFVVVFFISRYLLSQPEAIEQRESNEWQMASTVDCLINSNTRIEFFILKLSPIGYAMGSKERKDLNELEVIAQKNRKIARENQEKMRISSKNWSISMLISTQAYK